MKTITVFSNSAAPIRDLVFAFRPRVYGQASMTLISLMLAIMMFEHSVHSQDLHSVEGDAMILGNLDVGSGLSASNLSVDGIFINRIESTAATTLELLGPNPMLQFESSTSGDPLAFFQSFGADLFLANRQNGNLILRTNNLNRMTINGSGDVLLRTGTRKAEITLTHANGSGLTNGVAIENSGNNDSYWTFYASNTDGNLELYYQGIQMGEFNSTTGAYTTGSDRRLKQNIHPLGGVLSRVSLLKPSSYTFRNDQTNRQSLGFIAQDIEPLFPEVVSKGKIGDSSEELYTLDYSGFGVIAIAAIQELMENEKRESARLRAENQELRSQLDRLSERLTKVEELIPSKFTAQTDLQGNVER